MKFRFFTVFYIVYMSVLAISYLLNTFDVIYFGTELTSAICRLFIIVGGIISIPLFILVNRIPPEDFTAKFFKFILMAIMLAALWGLLEDVRTYKSNG